MGPATEGTQQVPFAVLPTERSIGGPLGSCQGQTPWALFPRVLESSHAAERLHASRRRGSTGGGSGRCGTLRHAPDIARLPQVRTSCLAMRSGQLHNSLHCPRFLLAGVLIAVSDALKGTTALSRSAIGLSGTMPHRRFGCGRLCSVTFRSREDASGEGHDLTL
jgi:hypothetical protein